MSRFHFVTVAQQLLIRADDIDHAWEIFGQHGFLKSECLGVTAR